ncbi:hypothetical protein ALC60_07979, partial [Trachymyrmex zeteki]
KFVYFIYRSRTPAMFLLLSKNPSFGTGIKTVGPICSWQLNNQCAHHKRMRGVTH